MKKYWKALLFTLSLLCCTSSPLLGVAELVNKSLGDDLSATYNVPTIDEPGTTEINNSLNTAVNKLFNSKEVILDNITLKITLDDSDPTNVLTLNLSNVDLDFSELNVLNLNLSCDINLTYKAINENLSLRYDGADYLCITYRNNAFKFHAPSTLYDVFNILNSLDVKITDNSNLSKNIKVTSLFDELKSASVIKSVSSTENGGYVYLSKVDDYTIGTTALSNLAFQILADENDNPTGLKTNPEIIISDTENKSGKMKISLDCSIDKILENSTYQKSPSSAFSDVTDANSTLLSTISDIFCGNYTSNVREDGKKKSQVNIGIQANISKEESSTDSLGNSTTIAKNSIITGSLQADLTDVFQDNDAGEFNLTLSHKASESSQNSYNDISAYFDKRNTYISFNDLFKGHIANSSLTDLFSTISEVTDIPSFKSVTDELNLVFTKTEKAGIANLTNGDYSGLYDLFESYTYSPSGFSITLNGDSFGLAGSQITVAANLQTKNGETTLKNISVTGLSVSSLIVDLFLTIENFTDIVKPDVSLYSDFSPTVSIFDNVADLLDKKKATAKYSLLYTDQNNVTFAADGKLGVDLSKATIDVNDNDRTLHTNEGEYYLSFDLPQDKNDTYQNNAVGQGIEMYFNDDTLYFGYQYYQNENYALTSGGPHYVFRNSITDTDLDTMYQLINKKVDSSSSDLTSSLSGMSGIIGAIASSSKLESIKNGLSDLSLKELDGVLALKTNEDNALEVTIDPSTFLVDTSYANNTSSIVLTLGSDNTVTKLSVNGKVDGQALQFDIELSDYESEDYSRFNTTDYVPITEGEAILDSVFALPTDLKQFDLSAKATVQKEGDSIPLVEMCEGTGASVDLTQEHDKASGVILIDHPSLSDSSVMISDKDEIQKIEFNYQELDSKITRKSTSSEIWNGEFLLEYNDNMHIKAQNQDVFDIIDDISGISSTNLLQRYLKFTSDSLVSSGSALLDLVNGKALSVTNILEYPYFQDITFGEGYLSLTVDPKIIINSADEGSYCTIKVSYSNETDNRHITGASIDAKYISGETTYDISAELKLTAGTSGTYERTVVTDSSTTATGNNILEYTDTTSSKFVDVNGFKILVDCLIDTTENNFFEFNGTLALSASVGSLDLISSSTTCYAAIYVQDETAYAYLEFKAHEDDISSEDCKITEIFVKEKEVICNQITTSYDSDFVWDWFDSYTNYTWTSTAVTYKTTSENLTENLLYYLLDYIMDFQSVKVLGISVGKTALNSIYGQTSSTSSSITLSDDFSQVINSAVYSNNSFSLDLNVGSLISSSSISMSFNTTKITLQHQTEDANGYKPLKSIALDIDVSLYSILNLTASSSSSSNTFTLTTANITPEQAQASQMKRYYSFTNQFYNDYGAYHDTSKLGMYLITSVTTPGSPEYTGSTVSHSDSKTTKSDKSYSLSNTSNVYLQIH